MKWLEKLAEQGLIRREIYDRIVGDVEQVKQAGIFSSESAQNLGKDIANIAKNTLVFMGVSAAGTAGANAAKKIMHRTTEDGIVKQIKANAETIINSPEFAKDKQKAYERYKDLCNISVNVAMNLPLAKALIQKNLYSGFSNDDVIRISTLQTLSHTAHAGGSEGLANSVRPHIMGKIAADVYLLQKEAAFRLNGKLVSRNAINAAKKDNAFGMMKALVGTSLIMGGVGAGVGYIADKIKGKNLRENLNSSFNDAVSRSELLKEKHEEARDAFKTLTHFAPHVALEPRAARSFMEKLVAYGDAGGHVDINDVKALSDINKNYINKPQSGASKGFGKMFAVVGGPKSVENMAEETAKEIGEIHRIEEEE